MGARKHSKIPTLQCIQLYNIVAYWHNSSNCMAGLLFLAQFQNKLLTISVSNYVYPAHTLVNTNEKSE